MKTKERLCNKFWKGEAQEVINFVFVGSFNGRTPAPRAGKSGSIPFLTILEYLFQTKG